MQKAFWTFFVVATVLFIAACNFGTPYAGSGDEAYYAPPLPEHTVVLSGETRALDSVFSEGMAVNYSGYRENQSPEDGSYPSKDEIQEDLEILRAMGFKLIRLFDTSTHAERVLEVIDGEDLDIKVMLGIWVIKNTNEEEFLATMEGINQAIEWAKSSEYKEHIVAVSVGNECIIGWSGYYWEEAPEDIARYVSYVRSEIAQPVTVDDSWEAWALDGQYETVRKVAEAVDFISLHTYPIADAEHGLWTWQQESAGASAEALMDAALVRAKESYNNARIALEGIGIDKPIVIGETGWKSQGAVAPIAHPVNQEMYYNRMHDWVYGNDPDTPDACFFFEAFDEPWKGGDDNWGLFTVERKAKYIVYSDQTWMTALSSSNIVAADDPLLTPDDAIYPVLPPDLISVSEEGTFVVFSDLLTGDDIYGEQLWDANSDGTPEATDMRWEAWENNSTAGVALESESGNDYAVITPDPADWGWGMMAFTELQGYDLSAFANGHLTFKIKTSYQGILEIGIQTGRGTDNDGQDMLISIDPSSNTTYGYKNDDEWNELSIPISALLSVAEASYGVLGSNLAGIEKVYVPFVIADRTEDGSSNTPIWVDEIRWTQN